MTVRIEWRGGLVKKPLIIELESGLDPIVVKLREVREARGWSRQRLAGRIGGGSGFATVRAWEVGDVNPTVDRLHQWAYSLGYRVELVPADDRTRRIVVTQDSDVIQLRDVRESRGWSRRFVADAADVSLGALRDWESGDAAPVLVRLRRWAAALHYAVELVALD